MGICQQSRCLSRPRTESPGPALNIAASWGACGVSRYGRYKSRLWRHTHDTLVSQNDWSPLRQAGGLLRRERELWQLHLFWKPTVTAGSRIAAAPIKPGTSNYFTASAARGCCRCMISRSSTGGAIMVRRRRSRTSVSASRTRRSAPRNSRKQHGTDVEPSVAVLSRERDEALEQQTATSEMLQVISRSAFDLQPVLETIVRTASRLCDAEYAVIFRLQDGRYSPVAANNASAEFIQHAAQNPIPAGRGSLVGRTALERTTVHIPDCLADPEYDYFDYQKSGKYRTILGVPLMRESVPIGVIGLLRTTVKPFTNKQIELVTTFGSHAVIAIENTRLLNELRQRTDDLSESLRQQTATADGLKVISRSTFNLQVVLDTLAESAARLCDAPQVWLFRRDGEVYRWAAGYGYSKQEHERTKQVMLTQPFLPGRGSVVGRVAIEGRVVQITDVLAARSTNRLNCRSWRATARHWAYRCCGKACR